MNDAFKALSDPTRRKILQLLKDQDLSAGDIAEHFDISKPSISHHLNILKQAQLVQDERHGQSIIYSINMSVMQEAMSWFLGMIGTKGENPHDESR
ncbi:transcriptional regulator [Cohnella sp. CIP 111063]|jgi:Predicted transcriptional regulators|uniref:autorepressor SdpR family transcription factor n=1 Tax=unclassified Cohnella TaxID=2636738 RepID=UPI000B8C2C71|nr:MULTISPECIES: autorepressor SdpR family transcription factor [unclassified Cohnella]OXS55831.1 transcriptional regulator [Cohnella sp. CIP 111063]PRX67029.1 ArsR family transcriptional regulator [Cohnella sp. SGD-V74]